jgi:hypothetical protein
MHHKCETVMHVNSVAGTFSSLTWAWLSSSWARNCMHSDSFEYVANRGLSLVILHLLLLTVDVALWEKFRINYAFILSMEHCVGVRKERLFSYTMITLAMTCISFLIYFIVSSPSISGQVAFDMEVPIWNMSEREAVPLTLIVLLAGTFLNPTPIVINRPDNKNKNPRVWFLKTIFEALVTPIYKVEFQHFFLADQIVSQGVALQDLAMATCFFLGGNFATESTGCATVLIHPHTPCLTP